MKITTVNHPFSKKDLFCFNKAVNLVNQNIQLDLNVYFFIECECNPEGSHTTTCKRETGQCACNQGWEGKRCEINQGKFIWSIKLLLLC